MVLASLLSMFMVLSCLHVLVVSTSSNVYTLLDVSCSLEDTFG